MASTPVFINEALIGLVRVASAYTTIDGAVPASLTVLCDGGTTGARVLEIDAQCAATSAAGLINIFLSIDNGVSYYLFDQIAIAAATVSPTVKGNRNSATYQNLLLKDSTHKIAVATTIAQAVNVIALGGKL